MRIVALSPRFLTRPGMIRTLVFTLTLALVPMLAAAELARPESVDETLEVMLERLMPNYPEARIDPDTQSIILNPGGAVVYPDNIHAVLQLIEDPAERERELQSFLETITASIGVDPIADGMPMDQVFPVLRHRDFVTNSSPSGLPLVHQPFLGSLVLVYAVDYPDRVAYLTEGHLTDTGTSEAQLEAAAMDNLQGKLAILRVESAGPGYVLAVDGFYESSMLMLPGLWDHLAELVEDDVMVIAPSRDLVVFMPANDPDALPFLRFVLEDVTNTASHPLSSEIYLWSDRAWSLVE